MNKTIENLRIPLTLLVIICHAGADNVVAEVIRNEIACLAVPTFFVISGYLFFLKMKEWTKDVYVKKLKSRVHTLLIPYLLWIPLYVCFKAYGMHCSPMDLLRDYGWGNIYWKALPTLGGATPLGFDNTSWGPFYGPFWYVEHLMILCLLSPVIYYLCKIWPKWTIGVMGVLFLTGVGIPYSPVQMISVLFFSLGAYLALHGKELSLGLPWQRWMLYGVASIVFVAVVILKGNETAYWFARQVFMPLGVLTLLNVFSGWEIKGRLINALLSCSFFVYAAHMYIVPYTYSDKITWLWNGNNYLELTVFLIRPVVVYVVLSVVYYILHRFTPKVLDLFSGSR